MHFRQTLHRTCVSALIISLVGCGGAPIIGAEGTPFMGPGEGLVVGSLVYTKSPTSQEYRFFVYFSDYVVTGGQGENFGLGTFHGVPRYVLPTPRNPEETPPVLMMAPAKAGKYRIKLIRFSGDERHTSYWPENAKEIEVRAGEITYVGSTIAHYHAGYDIRGNLKPGTVRPSTRDDFDLDIAALKTVEKRLELTKTNNAITR